MKKLLFLSVAILLTVMAGAQNEVDSLPAPKVNVKVNKIYDENGNLIRYDSTYVWSWSNADTAALFSVDPDSLFQQFKPFFQENFFHFPEDPFSSRFFSDSSMYFDFFNNDHFFDRWQDDLFNFQKEIERMDSLKQIFLQKFIEEEKNKRKEHIITY